MPAYLEFSGTPTMDASAITRSPGCHSVTSAPTSDTTPAMSMPAMWGKKNPGA